MVMPAAAGMTFISSYFPASISVTALASASPMTLRMSASATAEALGGEVGFDFAEHVVVALFSEVGFAHGLDVVFERGARDSPTSRRPIRRAPCCGGSRL